MLAKILGINKSGSKSYENVQREKDVYSKGKAATGGNGEEVPHPVNVNIAFPFRDEKATSFPAPLSIDASVLTEGEKAAAIAQRDAPGAYSQKQRIKRVQRGKRTETDDEDETVGQTGEIKEPKYDAKDKHALPSYLKETCSPELCNKMIAQKTPLENDIIPTKLTEMINTSIKEAVQTIVKQCSMVPEKQEGEKTDSKSKYKQDSLKRQQSERRKEQTCDRTRHYRIRSTKSHEKCAGKGLSPFGRKRSSSEKKSADDDKKKILEGRSKKLSKLEKNLKADNRRMTGNVNIYICSEANENMQVSGTKKDKSKPCAESSSETTTERSNGTYSRGGTCSSSKLIGSIEKRRKNLQKEGKRLDCLCEKQSSGNGSGSSSSTSRCSWKTEYKHSRPTTTMKNNRLQDVQDSSSGDIAPLNSSITSSTRDGCLCNDTNLSATDMDINSDISLPVSRFTACNKGVCNTSLYPVESEITSNRENVNGGCECRCRGSRFSSHEDEWKKRNAYERKIMRNSQKNRKENWSTCACIHEEDEEYGTNTQKVCRVPSEKVKIDTTSIDEAQSPLKKTIPCPQLTNNSKTPSKEITICCSTLWKSPSGTEKQTVCTNVLGDSVKPDIGYDKGDVKDTDYTEQKDVVGKGDRARVFKHLSLDESREEESENQEFQNESLIPTQLPSKPIISREDVEPQEDPIKTSKTGLRAPTKRSKKAEQRLVRKATDLKSQKSIQNLEAKKTSEKEQKLSLISRILKIIIGVFKPSQEKANKKIKEKLIEDERIQQIKEVGASKAKIETDKLKDTTKEKGTKDIARDHQHRKGTGEQPMKKVRSVYSIGKGERPKTKLEVILESRRGFTPKRSNVLRKPVTGEEDRDSGDNSGYTPQRKTATLSDTGNASEKVQRKQSSVAPQIEKVPPSLTRAKKVHVGKASDQYSEMKAPTAIDKESISRKSILTNSAVAPSAEEAGEKAKILPMEVPCTEIHVEQSQERKDTTGHRGKPKEYTVVPCKMSKSKQELKVCQCKPPDGEDCACQCNGCSKCGKPVKYCCCDKKERKKDICHVCCCPSNTKFGRGCGPCCKYNSRTTTCDACCKLKAVCECKKLVVCINCCKPKGDCSCKKLVECNKCKKIEMECKCRTPSVCIVCCRLKAECKCRNILICLNCCKPVKECRCKRPVTFTKCCKSRETGCCDKPMTCSHCNNPCDCCTCRGPMQRCPHCELLLDLCNCKIPEGCNLVGPGILNGKDNDEIVCVTAWRPKKDLRRYFSRTLRDECHCCEKPKPYGCEELPYQSLSVFSNVMNELQQKMSESTCCTRCGRVPCCCGARFDKDDQRKERKTKCRCGVITKKNDQQKDTPVIRVCCNCRTSPCKCKKAKSSQKKPRAKCYYCKTSPCTCFSTTESNKARPCRCVDSPFRGKEEETGTRAKPLPDSKNDGKLFCVRASKISICPASGKQRQHDNLDKTTRRRRNAHDTK